MNNQFQELLGRYVLGNSIGEYLVGVCVFLGVVVCLRLLKVVVAKRLAQLAKRTSTDIDDFIVSILGRIGPFIYFLIAFYVGTRSIVLSPSIGQIFNIVFVIVLTVKVAQVLQDVIAFFMKKWITRTEKDDPTSAAAGRNMMMVVRVVVWVGAIVFILDNLGINVTGVVTGLGIGGVAVALAAQAVLGDAFSSFAIYMDKPFKVGDFIIVGDLLGTVENVGFKTTRVRSLGGEQLIFSNSDLTNSRIRNYKRMNTRRIVFKLGVIYQTSAEKLKAIPQIIKGIIGEHELAKFDRAHFQSYGDFALIYEVVYYVLTPDYNKYMDVQQYINVRIFEAFKNEGIEFAYPTQQVYVTKAEPVTS